MIGWGVRMLMAGFCLALTLAKLSNGDDITLSAIATVCWFGSALLTYEGRMRR